MRDTAKYLVHADITADGIVERSDVVGAVFGQTEGLLGDELDLRELQDASKVGRIDVEIDSENGQSFGRITIATSLDRVETAILGAALETIDRVGPCRSTIEIRDIEDVRAAKRREVVERAKALLREGFGEPMRSSRDLVEEVRESLRVEDITDFEGLPAGPGVAGSDAVVVVEGRADVLTLLRCGITNAIGVEGTNVPEAVAELTHSRTVTAFLDGDRGGELIRRELAQVGDIDYVAFAPEGRSVEDLSRREVTKALREKVPYERVGETGRESPQSGSDPPDDALGGEATNGTTADAAVENGSEEAAANGPTEPTPDSGENAGDGSEKRDGADPETDAPADGEPAAVDADTDGDADRDGSADEPATLRGHVRAVVGEGSGRARLLDEAFGTLTEAAATEAFDLLADSETAPMALVVDGELDQRLLDLAAQRGVDQVVAASTGQFVKRPTSVRIRTAEQLLAPNEA
ncbi:DNA primase DnaG [Natronomonas sp.]|uniref:DNA primase DnaG n=1 Tax=Natronomonas sp. TaxID=2184060 RepID=UPI00261E09C4|nr:DNA primase DnaG [Natronomonas sp.]